MTKANLTDVKRLTKRSMGITKESADIYKSNIISYLKERIVWGPLIGLLAISAVVTSMFIWMLGGSPTSSFSNQTFALTNLHSVLLLIMWFFMIIQMAAVATSQFQRSKEDRDAKKVDMRNKEHSFEASALSRLGFFATAALVTIVGFPLLNYLLTITISLGNFAGHFAIMMGNQILVSLIIFLMLGGIIMGTSLMFQIRWKGLVTILGVFLGSFFILAPISMIMSNQAPNREVYNYDEGTTVNVTTPENVGNQDTFAYTTPINLWYHQKSMIDSVAFAGQSDYTKYQKPMILTTPMAQEFELYYNPVDYSDLYETTWKYQGGSVLETYISMHDALDSKGLIARGKNNAYRTSEIKRKGHTLISTQDLKTFEVMQSQYKTNANVKSIVDNLANTTVHLMQTRMPGMEKRNSDITANFNPRYNYIQVAENYTGPINGSADLEEIENEWVASFDIEDPTAWNTKADEIISTHYKSILFEPTEDEKVMIKNAATNDPRNNGEVSKTYRVFSNANPVANTPTNQRSNGYYTMYQGYQLYINDAYNSLGKQWAAGNHSLSPNVESAAGLYLPFGEWVGTVSTWGTASTDEWSNYISTNPDDLAYGLSSVAMMGNMVNNILTGQEDLAKELKFAPLQDANMILNFSIMISDPVKNMPIHEQIDPEKYVLTTVEPSFKIQNAPIYPENFAYKVMDSEDRSKEATTWGNAFLPLPASPYTPALTAGTRVADASRGKVGVANRTLYSVKESHFLHPGIIYGMYTIFSLGFLYLGLRIAKKREYL